MERNTPDVRATYDPKWRNLILGSRGAPGEVHSYTSLKRCWIWMFYRTSRIFLLRDILEILNWMFKLPEPSAAVLAQSPEALPRDPTIIPKKATSSSLDNVGLRIHHAFATTHLVNILEKSCSAIFGTLTVPIYGKSSQDVCGMRGYTLLWSLGIMDAVLKAGLVPDLGAPPSPPSSNEVSPNQQYAQPGTSFSHFLNMAPPSPAVFRMPPQNMHPLYHNGPVIAHQTNDFPRLPPVPAQTLIPDALSLTQLPESVEVSDISATMRHVFDTSPPHPFDYPANLPTLDFAITEPARIDVAARREWINCILYYIASELGVKKAISVPAAEGYLDLCKARLRDMLVK